MICCQKINKTIKGKAILQDVSFSLPNKGLVILKGENGSGKTSLLNIIALLDCHYSGEYFLNDTNVNFASKNQKSEIKSREISYVFQKHNLISFLDSKENENIEKISNKQNTKEKGEAISNLSQGQQELIALKRSLIPGKKIYLLDEILGCLDISSQSIIINQILELAKSSLVILVSHDVDLTSHADSIIELGHGKLLRFEDKHRCNRDNIRTVFNANKTKKHLSYLFKKQYKKDAWLHFLNVAFLFLTVFLGYIGVLVCHSDTCFALTKASDKKDALVFRNRIGFSCDQLMNEFPDNAFEKVMTNSSSKSLLVFSNLVPDDGSVYCNSYMQEKNLLDDLFYSYYNSQKISFPLIIDDSLKTNLFFVGKTTWSSAISYFSSKEDNGTKIFLPNGCWNTPSHNANYYSSETKDIYYIDSKRYESIFNKSLNFVPEDNTMYTQFSDLVVDGKTNFDSPCYSSKNEIPQIDLNEVFPTGVNVKYMSGTELISFSSYGYSYVVVSDNTMSLLNQFAFSFSASSLISLSSNKKSILNFLSNNNFTVSGTTLNESKDFALYNQECSYNTNKSNTFSYNILTYLMPCIFAIFQVLDALLLNGIHQNDDRVLDSIGFSFWKRFRLSFYPIILDTIIASFLGCLSAHLFFLSNGDAFTSILFGGFWLLSLMIIAAAISLFVYKWGQKQR